MQHERQARIAAEIQARKLEALSKEEGAKVQQLEDSKQKLEMLLQEEKQALRDEEIGEKICILFAYGFIFCRIVYLKYMLQYEACKQEYCAKNGRRESNWKGYSRSSKNCWRWRRIRDWSSNECNKKTSGNCKVQISKYEN